MLFVSTSPQPIMITGVVTPTYLVPEVNPVPGTVMPAQDAYRMYANTDNDQFDLEVRHDLRDNIPELKKACDAMPNCTSFNSWGYLKSKADGGLHDTTGYNLDYYVKNV